MPYARRSFAGAAPATTLNTGISNADMTIILTSGTGWPTGSSGDFFIVIDKGNPGEEKIRCASRSGTSITVQTAGRGSDGTSAATHAAGVAIEHVITATDADEANYAVSETVGKVAAAGDLLYGSAANTFAKLAKGTSGQYLKQGASTPSWASLASTDISDLAETVQDNIGAAMTAGTNITVTYNDGAGTITIAQTNATSTGITDFTEAVQDVVGALGLGGSGLTFTYTDGSNTAVLAVNVDNSSIEIAADILQVKAGGITTSHIADGTIAQGDLAAGFRSTYSGASAPASPAEGDHWYDTTNDLLQVYDGAAWVVMGVGALISYTPTLLQNGVSKTKTVNYCKYTYGNHHATMWFDLTATQAGSAGTPIDIGLPIACDAGTAHEIGLGGVRHFRFGSFIYIAEAFMSTTSASRASLDFSSLISTQALANGDALHGILNWPI